MTDDDDPELLELLGPSPNAVAARIAAARAVVAPTKRAVRVGPLDDIHDVRHEASRLYRAIRTSDGSDPWLVIIAPHAIRALKLVLDAVKNAELEEQVINIRRLLEGKKPLAPKDNKRRGMNGLEHHP